VFPIQVQVRGEKGKRVGGIKEGQDCDTIIQKSRPDPNYIRKPVEQQPSYDSQRPGWLYDHRKKSPIGLCSIRQQHPYEDR